MKSLLCGALLAGSMLTSHDVGEIAQARTDLARSERSIVHGLTDTPELQSAPPRVALPRDGRAFPIALIGDQFGPHVSVQVMNAAYVFTYAQASLTRVSTRSLEFDGAQLEDGIYTVTVRAGSQRSRALTMVVVSRHVLPRHRELVDPHGGVTAR